MNDYDLYNVDNVVDYFNIDEMKRIISSQITTNDDFSVCSTMIDHLQPLYNRYKNISVDPTHGITVDDVDECRRRFNAISFMFIDAICKKFGIHVSDFWLENASDDQIALLTLYLYTFFVIDFKTVLSEVIENYINANIDDLLSNFETSPKAQKDNVYKKSIDPKFAVLCINIFDVIFYILDNLDAETYFQYAPEDYLPLPYLTEMFGDCNIEGDFTGKIFEMAKNNVSLKSILAFEVVAYIKTAHSLTKEDKTNDNKSIE